MMARNAKAAAAAAGGLAGTYGSSNNQRDYGSTSQSRSESPNPKIRGARGESGSGTSRWNSYKYASIPNVSDVPEEEDEATRIERESRLVEHLKYPRWKSKKRKIRAALMMTGLFLGLFLLVAWVGFSAGNSNTTSCDSVNAGYQCEPEISHFWGQYSSYFKVHSRISTKVPHQCSITFAQVLSRHGARDPTASKTTKYNQTIQQIQQNVKNFTGKYAFLANYEYTLGADQLTVFGQQQMINSGISFYKRYEALTKDSAPFVRSSGEARVVESAMNWTQGFHSARALDKSSKDNTTAPIVNVVISEDDGTNNTLNHGLCTSFEDDFDSTIADSSQAIFTSTFIPAITTRLNSQLLGANLTQAQTIFMMDLCPFNTVASPTGQISDFCDLFTVEEWRNYDYYQTLGKYYGFSYGNPLGPTQGVGFVNELIARLTNSPVVDHTSTNSTLDSNPTTFPISNATKLYADFSHDNDITGIISALGLYNTSIGLSAGPTSFLSNTTIETAAETGGYSAAWTVPFAARVYVEKMACAGEDEELVRILINERVVDLASLDGCAADSLGRCKLSDFVASLGFAEEGGDWASCFV